MTVRISHFFHVGKAKARASGQSASVREVMGTSVGTSAASSCDIVCLGGDSCEAPEYADMGLGGRGELVDLGGSPTRDSVVEISICLLPETREKEIRTRWWLIETNL